MADPREGVTPDGLIVTGARRDRVQSAYEPVLAYVLGRVAPEVSVHVYGSVANGTATVPTSDVDLLTIGLPAADASALGAEASAAFAEICRGVELAAASSDDYAGEGDEAYGNRVFLRHYCAHLAGPDPGEALPGFPADARAARGFNGDIGRALRRWRGALGRDDPSDLSRRIARKSLLAVAGLVSVHDGTWTTDRLAAAVRWSEIEPALAPELDRLGTLCDHGGASADETEAMLAAGGVIESIVARFEAEIGLWQPWTPPVADGVRSGSMTPDEVDAFVSSLDGCRHKPRGWYVHDRLVARLVDATTLLVRVPIERREALIERWPDAFGIPPRLEAHHKIEAYLDRASPDAVREAIRLAWEFQRYSGLRQTDT